MQEATKREITPHIREIDWKLRDIESGQLGKAEEYHVMQSICETLRAHLRIEYGLEAEDHCKGLTEQGGDVG